jgi:N-formylglutamate deformylase
MSFSHWNVEVGRALIATAVHNGHALRPEVANAIALDDSTRLREEDPYTGLLASYLGSFVVVNRSRFEVDLNRPPEEAVYIHPDDSWGIEVWNGVPDAALIERSLQEHHDFYRRLGSVLEDLVERHGGFVLYDLHSYNHLRPGPDGAAADPATNPVVNLGTGSLPPKWKPVAEAFLSSLGQLTIGGESLDARENVRFKGRYVARFVHDNFGDVGCALAIELKKVFMNEWTHELDEIRLAELGVALAKTSDPVQRAWEAICR